MIPGSCPLAVSVGESMASAWAPWLSGRMAARPALISKLGAYVDEYDSKARYISLIVHIYLLAVSLALRKVIYFCPASTLYLR
jgi:hypothetical protein